jgi:hypothetical protein
VGGGGVVIIMERDCSFSSRRGFHDLAKETVWLLYNRMFIGGWNACAYPKRHDNQNARISFMVGAKRVRIFFEVQARKFVQRMTRKLQYGIVRDLRDLRINVDVTILCYSH